MERFEARLKESEPTLVVFVHAGAQDAVDVKFKAESLRAKLGDKIHVMRVDCSYNGALKERYRIDHYPTWILFKEGQELMREAGNKPEADLLEMIKTAL